MACAEYYADLCVQTLANQLDKKCSPYDQLKQLLTLGLQLFDQSAIDQINSPVNMTFHKLLMVAIVKKLAPIYADVFEQGNASGDFSIQYPLETAESLLTLSNFYLDKDFFSWTEEELSKRVTAYSYLFDTCLGSKILTI